MQILDCHRFPTLSAWLDLLDLMSWRYWCTHRPLPYGSPLSACLASAFCSAIQDFRYYYYYYLCGKCFKLVIIQYLHPGCFMKCNKPDMYHWSFRSDGQASTDSKWAGKELDQERRKIEHVTHHSPVEKTYNLRYAGAASRLTYEL